MKNTESKRIQKFKAEIIKDLPFFPNTREVKQELESQSLNALLFNYIHWALRKPPPRPRDTIIGAEVVSDHRWQSLSGDIQNFLQKVKAGEDLAPYLSKTVSRGYTSINRVKSGDADRWDDKDFLLNTKGFHHFHLGQSIESDGMAARTNDVLFAFVTRDTFHAVAIFDHSVFDFTDNEDLSAERARMWKIHERHVTQGMAPGTVYVSNPITTSGHPLFVHDIKNKYAEAIYQLDPKLNDDKWIQKLYEDCKISVPKKTKLEWSLMRMDLGLYNKEADCFFKIKDWPF
tara:strand:- start:195 stop:1058 length:864 start_codon:yes stop_codon:yes gene_type:complete